MGRTGGRLAWTMTGLLVACAADEAPPSSSSPAPAAAPAAFAAVDRLVAEAIAAGDTPGAVVAIGDREGVRYLHAYGDRVEVPAVEAMTTDTVFDLASLTKTLATATSVMVLVDAGKVDLDQPVAAYLPAFASRGKGTITVRDLLLHVGGLVPDNALDDYRDGPEEAWRRILDQAPVGAPGLRFSYSDVGYLVLGRLVEAVGGAPLDRFAAEHVFAPLGMVDTGFLPDAARRARAAATEPRDGAMLRGTVHDPRAALLGGVAGHAGLFATAPDLARFARMLLGEGELDGGPVMRPETAREMLRARTTPGGRRAPGFDVDTRFSSNRGDGMTDLAVGHGGFTGTALWVDPGLDLFVVFLGTRLHPDGEGTVNPWIGRIGAAAAAALRPDALATPRGERGDVLAGVDVVADGGAAGLIPAGRLGLVTNHTGRARDGRSTREVLDAIDGLQVVRLFSPEHGFRGTADAVVADGDFQGLPVTSLYGDTRKPPAASLADLDALVFDLQDAGARCYTYVSTMGLCMEAAAAAEIPFVVLDRPDPIGGLAVEGPLRDPDAGSFTAWHPLPVRHGMTVGELARMFVAERPLPVDLRVVPLRGWRRAFFFDETGLPWIAPSPNLRTVTEAELYPGVSLLEFTGVSVGRGTDRPFELVGAPWAGGLALPPLPGLRSRPVTFTPTARRHAGAECRGLLLEVTDRRRLEPVRVGLALACALRDGYPDWDREAFAKLLANRQVFDAFLAGADADALWALAQQTCRGFAERRAPFLLYEP